MAMRMHKMALFFWVAIMGFGLQANDNDLEIGEESGRHQKKDVLAFGFIDGEDYPSKQLICADWHRVTIRNCTFSDLRCIKSNLRGAKILDSNFVGAHFSKTDLSGATIENDDLSTAVFIESDLEGVKFKNCKLAQTYFNSSLRGARYWDELLGQYRLVTAPWLIDQGALVDLKALDSLRTPKQRFSKMVFRLIDKVSARQADSSF